MVLFTFLKRLETPFFRDRLSPSPLGGKTWYGRVLYKRVSKSVFIAVSDRAHRVGKSPTGSNYYRTQHPGIRTQGHRTIRQGHRINSQGHRTKRQGHRIELQNRTKKNGFRIKDLPLQLNRKSAPERELEMAFELVRSFFSRSSPPRSRTYESAMENGTFADQESYTLHGSRDVDESAEFSNWSGQS